MNPYDPEAQIARLKDGRTALAYKAEHAVDMDTGAIVAVTTHGGAVGDSTSVGETLPAAGEAVAEQIAESTADDKFKVNARVITFHAEVFPLRPADLSFPDCLGNFR